MHMSKVSGYSTNEKKQKDKDRVFGFLKKYIALSMFSIVLVISFVFFYIYKNLEISRITTNSNNSLQQLSLSCDSMFDSIRKLTFQVYNDADISSLVNDLSPDAVTTIRTYGRLSSFSSNTSNLISIYIYSKVTDSFYTTLPSVPKKSRIDFFDKEAVSFIDQYQNVKVLYPVPRKINQPGAPAELNSYINAYTFINYGVPAASRSNFTKAVIINVSELWIRKLIELWDTDSVGEICIINEDGTLVSSLYGDTMLLNMSQERFVSETLKSEKEAGFFICNVSNKKSFVTYVHSSATGWYFIRVIPYNTLYENITKIGLTTVALLILYIIIGFMLSYIITGKAKKNIDEIIDGLKKQIKDTRSDLEKLKDEYLYNSLINNISNSQECVQKDFEKYNIRLSAYSELLLILFKIDHFKELCEQYKSYDIKLLRQAVMKDIVEIFPTEYKFETVDMKDDHIILALNHDNSPEKTNASQIDGMIKLIQDSADKNIKLSISAVLSPSGYTFTDINLLYREVRQASNYRMFFGHKCIINSEDLKTLNPEEYVFPTEKEKMLLDALKLGKVETACKILDEILNSAKGYPYTLLNSLLLKIISSIGNSFESLESISKYSLDYNFNAFVETLNKCETLDEIRSKFHDMFNHVYLILEQQRNSKYGLLINKAIDIINQNYSDASLCLNMIASKLNISPGYLGKLFRTYTLKSVNDYINKIRVEKALKLLEECTMSINDIAAASGFCSRNYFYTVFKRIIGVTPAEYRQKSKIENVIT